MSNHPHDAPFNPNTISRGLSLSDSCFDSLANECVNSFKKCDSVSDTILDCGNSVRSEELDVPGSLTRYEKKLLLAGYFVGKIHAGFENKREEIQKMMGGLFGGLERKKEMDQEGED